MSQKLSLDIERNLKILETAISDVGYWTWWTSKLPEVIQIEFCGTQLYFQPLGEGEPPNSLIAIQFIKPKSISFLTRNESEYDLAPNWEEKLSGDELDFPTCNYDRFTFTDKILGSEILEAAKVINTIYGESPQNKDFFNEKYWLIFWAQNYGFAVSAEDIKLVTHKQDVDIAEIEKLHLDWWEYCKKYWELKRANKPFIEDYACECTIPL